MKKYNKKQIDQSSNIFSDISLNTVGLLFLAMLALFFEIINNPERSEGYMTVNMDKETGNNEKEIQTLKEKHDNLKYSISKLQEKIQKINNTLKYENQRINKQKVKCKYYNESDMFELEKKLNERKILLEKYKKSYHKGKYVDRSGRPYFKVALLNRDIIGIGEAEFSYTEYGVLLHNIEGDIINRFDSDKSGVANRPERLSDFENQNGWNPCNALTKW